MANMLWGGSGDPPGLRGTNREAPEHPLRGMHGLAKGIAKGQAHGVLSIIEEGSTKLTNRFLTLHELPGMSGCHEIR